jgi:hypothetical protein
MGQAKIKREKHAELRSGKYMCVYCGGVTPATEVEHFPAKITFDLKLRPNDLVFPACTTCNRGSADLDQIAGFLTRMLPDQPRGSQTDNEQTKIIGAVIRKYPEVASALIPQTDFRQVHRLNTAIPPNTVLLKMDDPYLHRVMHLFAAKAALALHYRKTGKPLSPTGIIYTSWYTNFQAIYANIPDMLARLFPNPETLEQGTWNVRGQFQFKSQQDEGGNFTAHAAGFRFSFLVMACCSETRVPGEFEGMTQLSPGCFAGGYPYGMARLSHAELSQRFRRQRVGR